MQLSQYETERSANSSGAKAFKLNIPYGNNPYALSHLKDSWEEGWRNAQMNEPKIEKPREHREHNNNRRSNENRRDR